MEEQNKDKQFDELMSRFFIGEAAAETLPVSFTDSTMAKWKEEQLVEKVEAKPVTVRPLLSRKVLTAAFAAILMVSFVSLLLFGGGATVNLPSITDALPKLDVDSLMPAADTVKFLGMMMAIGWLLFAADNYMKKVSL